MASLKRIVLNSMATYFKGILAAFFALFSSRWILESLGASDLGLFSLVGAIILFISFLNSVMSSSACRHFAFSIGQGDVEDLNGWFNTSLSIHLLLPGVLILVGWPVGEYCIQYIFSVSVDRIDAALWVFRISLISAFTGMVSVPFVAMFSAKQHIAEFSLWGMLQSTLSFALAYILTQIQGDRLLIYAIFSVLISVSFNLIMIFRARLIFPECKINSVYFFDKVRFKEIFSFAIWNMIGCLGGILRDQGCAILLNLYFNTKVNASFGIARQVSIQTSMLSSSMTSSLYPEITTSAGNKDYPRMISLALRASKFGTLFLMVFALPLIGEIDYVLKIWLKEPPEHTALFCRWMLIMFMIDNLTVGQMMAVNANGKIAMYQSTLGSLWILTLPLAWLFLFLGYPPESVGVAAVIMASLCSMGRVFWASYLVKMPAIQWLKNIFCPCILTMTMAFLPSFILPNFCDIGLRRFLISSVVSLCIICISGWFLILDEYERDFFARRLKKIIHKIKE